MGQPGEHPDHRRTAFLSKVFAAIVIVVLAAAIVAAVKEIVQTAWAG